MELKFGLYTDETDGQIYKTVKIGKQVWMAEDYRRYTDSFECSGNFFLAEKYGYSYTDDFIKDVEPPKGFALPQKKDFDALISFVLKSGFTWDDYGKALKGKEWGGSDDFGFNAIVSENDQIDFFYGKQGRCFSLKDQSDKFLESGERMDRAHVRFVMCDPQNWMPATEEEIRIYDEQKALRIANRAKQIEFVKKCEEYKYDSKKLKTLLEKYRETLPKPQFGVYTDVRDGEMYKTVKIGNQVWLAENVRFKSEKASDYDERIPALSEKYGRLYPSLADAEKAVPMGFHLPSELEINEMKGFVQNSGFVEKRFISSSLCSESTEEGVNAFGFNLACLKGYYSFWGNKEFQWGKELYVSKDFLKHGAVRCLMDEPSEWNPATEAELKAYDEFKTKVYASVGNVIKTEEKWAELKTNSEKNSFVNALNLNLPDPDFGYFTDSRDGNVYKTVTIGNQVWLAENLRFKPKNKKNYCVYENKPSNVDKYGYLYKSTELLSAIPEGCHLPSETEYESLLAFVKELGFVDNERASYALCSGEFCGYGEKPYTAKNLLGFGAVSAGFGRSSSDFANFGKQARFAFKDAKDILGNVGNAVGAIDVPSASRTRIYDARFLSIRCIVDVPVSKEKTTIDSSKISEKKIARKKTEKTVENSLSEVQYGIVTDPSDGQMYKTVKIGNQVWMAENLRNMENPLDGIVLAPGNDIMNIEKYGCLYSICYPRGSRNPHYYGCTWENWKVPEAKDFKKLETYINSLDKEAGSVLKSREGWTEKKSLNGDDLLGFSAYPAGTIKRNGLHFFSSDTVEFGKKAYFACEKNGAVCVIQNNKIEYTNNCNAVSVRFVMKNAKGWKPASAEELALYEQKKVEIRKKLQKFKAWEATLTREHIFSGTRTNWDRDAQKSLITQWMADVPKPQFGVFKDSRDGQMYKTVKIGNQVWFAENLRYDCSAVQKPSNCLKEKYGNFYEVPTDPYDFSVIEQVIPAGWRLPKEDDLQQLRKYVSVYSCGIFEVTSSFLSAKSKWDELNCDAFGFNGAFSDGLYIGNLWTSMLREGKYSGNIRCLMKDPSSWVPASDAELIAYEKYTQERLKPFITRIENEEEWLSCKKYNDKERCLKFLNRLAAEVPKLEFGEYQDARDGLLYRTVKIGNRTWLAENLRYNHKASLPCNKNKNLMKEYGRLYPKSSLTDVVPEGWRLPNQKDIDSLKDVLVKYEFVDSGRASCALRSKSWSDGVDVFGLNILGAGRWSNDECFSKEYSGFGEEAFFWCREGDVAVAIHVYDGEVKYYLEKHYGSIFNNEIMSFSLENIDDSGYYSIRLVKDE